MIIKCVGFSNKMVFFYTDLDLPLFFCVFIIDLFRCVRFIADLLPRIVISLTVNFFRDSSYDKVRSEIAVRSRGGGNPQQTNRT